MQVADIMHRDVVTVRPEETFSGAARVMSEHRVSSLVVVQGDHDAAGIVTERDLVAVVAEGLDPGAVRVEERMTRDPATVAPDTDLLEAARLMAERRIHHLPVVDRARVVGIISIRDLTSWAVEELTGGHEKPDLERSSAALTAALEVERGHR
jgi:CBS domain-containing protein